MKTTFRAALESDVSALHALVNSAYRGESSKAGWTTEADFLGGQRIDPERLTELIRDPRQTILCLFDESNRLIGTVCLERTDGGRAFYLGMLTVNPSLQTAGLGKKLMIHAEAFAIQAGAVEMTLGVVSPRVELMAWYERRGYKKTGQTLPFPYGDVRFGEPKRDDLHFVMFAKPLV